MHIILTLKELTAVNHCLPEVCYKYSNTLVEHINYIFLCKEKGGINHPRKSYKSG